MSTRINRLAFAIAVAKADLTVNQLAAASGLSRGTLSAVKNGKSCTDDTAQRLADALGVTMDYLTREPVEAVKEAI